MSLKTLGRKATARVGRHVLTVQKHSPVLMITAGAVGVVATAVLAGRATLRLSEVLKQGEETLKKVENADNVTEEETEEAAFGLKLRVAIDVAKLYAPTVIVGVASVCLIAGSHNIMRKRNAGLAAAYTVAAKQLRDYRGRVVKDQGAEKDYEYFHGVEEREIVVEGKNGPETKTVKGLDQDAIRTADPETEYRRLFHGPVLDSNGELIEQGNKYWNPILNQNQFFLEMIQSQLNDLLRMQGYVFLNDAYDLLGFPKTDIGQVVGWVKNPRVDKNNEPTGDGYIDFGVWNDGVFQGKQWLNGNKDAVLLEMNVDGPILYAMNRKDQAA